MPLTPSAHQDTFCRDNLPPESSWPEFLPVPNVQYPDRLNAAVELLEATCARLGADRDCLITPDGQRWTYGDLMRTSAKIANLLAHDYGLVPGNRVLLRGPNSPWLVACWFAVLRAGAVAVSTVPMLRSREIRPIVDKAEITLLMSDARIADELAEFEAQGHSLCLFGPGSDFEDRLKEESDTFTSVQTAADDVALLAFTSGTTGGPKATMHFHRDVLAIADTFSRAVLSPTQDDVFSGTPPLAFTFGLGGLVIFPMRVGASSLLVEKAAPPEFAELIERFGVTMCFTAPTAYRAIIAAGKGASLRTIRRAVSAGEHLPASTWHAVHDETGIRLIDGIGATEMLHIFISSSPEDIRPGSTGQEVPGYEARIIDEDGAPVAPGEVGRLAVKGPTGCRYLADPRQTTYVQGGWNVTGDLFTRDEDGYFWYHSRADDMIISSGYNIAAYEVEEALLTHPDVLECAVIGMPDEQRGQVVTAFVVAREGVLTGEKLKVSLQDRVKSQIAPFKYPRNVRFVEALPRTTTGKLQRYALRDKG